MNREAIFEIWAPPGGEWSLWARPILFAQMPDTGGGPASAEPGRVPGLYWAPGREPWNVLDVAWAPGTSERVVLVVDLPGEESVRTGLALAGRGYRPVPLYNACTGPHEVIDQRSIIAALQAGAGYLASQALTDAAPALLLDAMRMSPAQEIRPGVFDNRWQVFPQDFPSAAFLMRRGFTRALLVQRSRLEPQEDMEHVLLRWQEAGMVVEAKDVARATVPASITIARPQWYRAAWQRVLAILHLRRGLRGGFGGEVPSPRHG
jgi:hypothetical protein